MQKRSADRKRQSKKEEGETDSQVRAEAKTMVKIGQKNRESKGKMRNVA